MIFPTLSLPTCFLQCFYFASDLQPLIYVCTKFCDIFYLLNQKFIDVNFFVNFSTICAELFLFQRLFSKAYKLNVNLTTLVIDWLLYFILLNGNIGAVFFFSFDNGI